MTTHFNYGLSGCLIAESEAATGQVTWEYVALGSMPLALAALCQESRKSGQCLDFTGHWPFVATR